MEEEAKKARDKINVTLALLNECPVDEEGRRGTKV